MFLFVFVCVCFELLYLLKSSNMNCVCACLCCVFLCDFASVSRFVACLFYMIFCVLWLHCIVVLLFVA